MTYRNATLLERQVRDGKRPYSQSVTGVSGDSVAIDPSYQVTVLEIVGASNNTFTLGDGVEGQHMTLRAGSKGGAGDGLLQPSNLNGGTTITFDAADETAELEFFDGGWNMIGGTATLS